MAAALLTAFGTAQTKAEDTRLYGFSSGALTLGKGALLNFAPMSPSIVVPVGFYVVKHRG